MGCFEAVLYRPQTEEFAAWNAQVTQPSPRYAAITWPFCTQRLAWRDKTAVETDIANLKAALQHVQVADAFIPSASIGIIAKIMFNRDYPSEEAYLFALADVMKEEYTAIADTGFILQIDAPDAACAPRS